MAGHALDILFNDNLDADHERLTRINHTLSLLTGKAGTKTPLRTIETLMLSPSEDLRVIARRFQHELPRAIRLLMRSLGSWGSDGRLVSYLLFESGYIGALIDLGYGDTMARADEIRDFLEC
jgi:NTE family protein